MLFTKKNTNFCEEQLFCSLLFSVKDDNNKISNKNQIINKNQEVSEKRKIFSEILRIYFIFYLE